MRIGPSVGRGVVACCLVCCAVGGARYVVVIALHVDVEVYGPLA